jgi:hypothetical protein
VEAEATLATKTFFAPKVRLPRPAMGLEVSIRAVEAGLARARVALRAKEDFATVFAKVAKGRGASISTVLFWGASVKSNLLPWCAAPTSVSRLF